MPTLKPLITFHVQEEYLEKMRYIAREENRSLSNLMERLCRLYIKEYEEENGKIEVSMS